MEHGKRRTGGREEKKAAKSKWNQTDGPSRMEGGERKGREWRRGLNKIEHVIERGGGWKQRWISETELEGIESVQEMEREKGR